ncbi:MAG: PilW family protein [Burkholderiaceae bacterium]|nr:PilW family protein [Burkholderiaceae bacterium]
MPPRPRQARARRRPQTGLSLLELMVGMTIGLFTVAAALGSLVVLRSITSTVSEASQLQLQAGHTLRTIGQQIRQGGSIKLNLGPGKTDATINVADGVAFEKVFARASQTLVGNDSPAAGQYHLQIGYQNYADPVTGSGTPAFLFRDCLGQASSTDRISSGFVFEKAAGALSGSLKCAGNDQALQTIAGNVADFRVRYLLQDLSTGTPQMRYANAQAAQAAGWSQVHGVEICLELIGNQSTDTAGATYLNCNGDSVNMGNRLHMVFRNSFQIRSQGFFG